MARSAGTRRTGPGYAGLIIFIVLCMALIGGYVWLVPEYTFAVSEMVRLNSDIKSELENRVGSELGIRSQATTKRSERGYDTAFLRKVGDSASDGDAGCARGATRESCESMKPRSQNPAGEGGGAHRWRWREAAPTRAERVRLFWFWAAPPPPACRAQGTAFSPAACAAAALPHRSQAR